jgi:putative N6-adenine-specific DNA methylase
LVATCARGLEAVLAGELQAMEAESVRAGRGMVEFRGTLATVIRANLGLRSAMRVLLPLASGSLSGRDDLYQLASSISWERLMARHQSFAVEVAGRSRPFRDTSFGARVVKDAVVDRMRRCHGERPDVDRDDPDLRIHLHLSDRQTTLSLDSSGRPLSQRGYRRHGGPAPLAESLAAGILLLAGYDGSQPLVDPMCGSGTLAVEAALIATRRAPGLGRRFAFERWPRHQPELLEQLRRRAQEQTRPAPAAVHASDRDGRAVAATRRNLAAAGVERWVEVQRQELSRLEVPFEGGLIVLNPPYGHRLGDEAQLAELYRLIGSRLKHHAAGNTAWVLAGSRALAAAIGLKASRRIVLFNGPIECRLLRFDLYQGTERRRNRLP